MSALLQKLKKTSTIKEAEILSASELFNEKDVIPTAVPALNIALSGDIDGGIRSGLISFAGESKTFKTSNSLVLVSAYLKKYPNAICVFYDCEFGVSANTLKAANIDPNRVLHCPITSIEELKFDLMAKLTGPDAVSRDDKVIIMVDSVGNLASTKETNDAMKENAATDMGTRAKSLKSLWRLVTPHLTIKDIPLIAIQHTYAEQGAMYAKTIMAGGQGGMLSSDVVFFIGKSQEKDGTELKGYNFKLKVEKSRYVKEKSVIPIIVTFEGGIYKYTGILDMAIEAKHVVKPSNGWYQLVDPETGEELGSKVREKDTGTEEFLGVVLKRESFKHWVREKYQLSHNSLVADETTDADDELLAELEAAMEDEAKPKRKGK